MQIGIDIRMLSSPAFSSRGMGRYVKQLLSAMSSLAPEDEFVLLTADQTIQVHGPRQQTTPIGPMPSFSKIGLWNQHVQLPIRLAQSGLRLIHFPFSEVAPAWMSADSKVVVTAHDMIRFQVPNSTLKHSIFNALYRRTLRSASAIIAISSHVKTEVEEFIGKSPPPIHVVYHGVDRHVFHPIHQAKAVNLVASKYGIHNPFILYAGGFDQRKQVAELVRMFYALVNETNLPHLLVLVGRMEAYPSFIEVVQTIAQLKLFNRVILTDYVPDEDLVYLYNAADIFAFPSSGEGFGFPLLEAMACGTPVVAFNNTSIPEVMGTYPLLVADGDWDQYAETVHRTILSKSMQEQMRVTGLERAKEFRWEQTARQTLRIYAEA